MSAVTLLAVAVAALSVPVMRSSPRATIVVYLVAVAFVPYWVGIQVGPQYIPLSFGVAIWAAVVAHARGVKLLPVDLVLGVFFALVLVGTLLGRVEAPHAFAAVGSWFAPFLVGRHIALRLDGPRLGRIIAVVGALLAIQAIVEFCLDWHPFVNLMWETGPADIWRTIQYRSRFPRSEGAMGHSISLGGAIALSVPFILTTPWSARLKVGLLGLAACGVALTFSRNALIALGLSVVLTSLFASESQVSRRMRRLLVTGTIAVIAFVVPTYLRTIDGGTGVLAASTDYRSNYVSLLPDVSWFGLAPIYTEYAPGRWGWQSELYANNVVVTLDNTVLLTALQFGWIPAAAFIGFLGMLGISLLKTRGSVALVAACGQYFTVATVAMITQYPYLLWLVFGMAVTDLQRRRTEGQRGTAAAEVENPEETTIVSGAPVLSRGGRQR